MTGLGQLQKLYRSASIYRTWGLWIALLTFGPLAYRLLSRQPFHQGAGSEVLLALLGAPLVFWLLWGRRRDAAAVYDDGIACSGQQGLVMLKWSEISRVWKTPGDRDLNQPPRYYLATLHGGQVELVGLTEAEELWATIEKNVCHRPLPE